MGEIKNVATLIKDEQANISRVAIKHRTTWTGLIYDEFRKTGIDPESIFRKVTRRCGNIHGESFKAACSDPEDCRDFAKVFLNDLGRETPEQEVRQVIETEVPVDLHYCALLSAWKKLGFDGEACIVPCGIVTDGDRGTVEAMGLDLELTDTLAKERPTCKLCFHK